MSEKEIVLLWGRDPDRTTKGYVAVHPRTGGVYSIGESHGGGWIALYYGPSGKCQLARDFWQPGNKRQLAQDWCTHHVNGRKVSFIGERPPTPRKKRI